nr:hypothetical protein CFP56_72834 [Quercus suber]
MFFSAPTRFLLSSLSLLVICLPYISWLSFCNQILQNLRLKWNSNDGQVVLQKVGHALKVRVYATDHVQFH